jgi:hypothetical protein
MGLYDSVICHQKLPEFIIEGKIVGFPEETVFQTKDFESVLDIYHIDIHNRLLRKQSTWSIDYDGHVESYYEGPFEVIPFHGIFEFYTSYKAEEEYFVCFIAKFTDGLLVSLIPEVEKI